MMRNMYLSAAEGQRNNGKDDHKLGYTEGNFCKTIYILVMHSAQLTETPIMAYHYNLYSCEWVAI